MIMLKRENSYEGLVKVYELKRKKKAWTGSNLFRIPLLYCCGNKRITIAKKRRGK